MSGVDLSVSVLTSERERVCDELLRDCWRQVSPTSCRRNALGPMNWGAASGAPGWVDERGDYWGLIAAACGRFHRLQQSEKWVMGTLSSGRWRCGGTGREALSSGYAVHPPPRRGGVRGANSGRVAIFDVL